MRLPQVDSDASGSLEFDEFVDLMEETWKTKEEQLEELREAFLTFDQDGNGFITKEELIETLVTLGDPIDQCVMDTMIHEADKDGDGEIDYDEFINLMLHQ
jgi:calmodulin